MSRQYKPAMSLTWLMPAPMMAKKEPMSATLIVNAGSVGSSVSGTALEMMTIGSSVIWRLLCALSSSSRASSSAPVSRRSAAAAPGGSSSDAEGRPVRSRKVSSAKSSS